MLKILLTLVLTLAALDLAVLGARMAASIPNEARLQMLERQVAAQRAWIQQREAMASGRYSYYDPSRLGELEGGETRPHGLVRSVSPGLGGTPYANWRP
jgi:hypothetical protein